MATCIWALILPWVLSPSGTVDAGPEQEWEQAMASLRASEGLSASIIGFAHTPSPRFAQYEAIILSGDGPRFRAMVRDTHPVVRCIGLMALAQTEGRGAVATLRHFLCDGDKVGYQVYDIGSSITVGEFALHLLCDPNALVVEKRRTNTSLLSETEWIDLNINILAEDTTLPVHEAAASSLISVVRRRRLTLDLPALRPYVPLLEDWQIVKAVGRMKPSKAPRAFLIACVENDDLDPVTRFAAASALTRDSDTKAQRALRVYREPLNRLDDARWGDFLVTTLNARRTHEKRMAPLRARRSWQRQASAKDRIIRAFTCDHPLALDDLTDVPGPTAALGHDEARQAVAGSIVAISGNLERFSQPWDTYSNTAFKLDLFIRYLRWMRPQMEPARAADFLPLTEAQCAEIERNISTFIAVSSPSKQPGAN